MGQPQSGTGGAKTGKRAYILSPSHDKAWWDASPGFGAEGPDGATALLIGGSEMQPAEGR